jgi:hypothetical protein
MPIIYPGLRLDYKVATHPGACKNAQGMITEPGNMVIYVAGYPAIMGLQPLYFRDSELARRARISAEAAQMKKLGDMLANANV